MKRNDTHTNHDTDAQPRARVARHKVEEKEAIRVRRVVIGKGKRNICAVVQKVGARVPRKGFAIRNGKEADGRGAKLDPSHARRTGSERSSPGVARNHDRAAHEASRRVRG